MNKYLSTSLILLGLLLSGCSQDNNPVESPSIGDDSASFSESISDYVSSSMSSEEEISSDSSEELSSESSSEEDEEQTNVVITLNKKELDVVVNTTKSIYLTINVPDGYEYDPEKGEWISSDDTIVGVSQYGKVIPHKVGDAYIRYIDSNGVKSTRCIVHVHESEQTIVRKWQKVKDFDSIQEGDEIVFASSELGVVATNNRKDGYIIPTACSFSNDGNMIEELSDEAAEFYIGGSDGVYTLENQYGYYLAGKSTTHGNGLLFVKSKGQIHWIFEKPESFDDSYCVNYDIQEDLWLMFNKINDSDIRFNLYDSNPGPLMKLPDVYRYEIVR